MQDLLDRKDVKTTMIYTHVLKPGRHWRWERESRTFDQAEAAARPAKGSTN